MQTATVGRAMAVAMAAEDPEYLRKHVVEAGAPDWIDGLLDSLKPRVFCSECQQTSYERWAFRLWAECAKLVGLPPQVNTLIVQQLGVPVDEARAAVGVVRSASADPDEVYEQALQHVRDEARRRGLKLLLVPFGSAGDSDAHDAS